MTINQTRPRPVDVEELKQAWHALQAGDFRNGGRQPTATPQAVRGEGTVVWDPAPTERVVPVIGAAGHVGATTTALAIAAAQPAAGQVRVVECGPPATSGLASASTVELGTTHESGWRRGKRDHVLLQRPTSGFTTPDQTPPPLTSESPEAQLTLLDAAWDPIQLFGGDSWILHALYKATEMVVVTTATVPGFRRLEMVLELTDQFTAPVRVAVIGPKRWPKPIASSAGTRTRALLAEEGRVVRLPYDRRLAVTGLDSKPLPDQLLTAAGDLITNPDLIIDEPLEEPTP